MDQTYDPRVQPCVSRYDVILRGEKLLEANPDP